jgi:phage head maturation protease
MTEHKRPQAGDVERRTTGVEVEGKKVRGIVPYNVESRDLGGWTEIIEPTAFREVRLDDLRAVIDHAGVPLGRYPATLDVEDRSDGLHWSLDPPRSRADVVEAIERGDMRAGSWRMVVARDRWVGDVRHVRRSPSFET